VYQLMLSSPYESWMIQRESSSLRACYDAPPFMSELDETFFSHRFERLG